MIIGSDNFNRIFHNNLVGMIISDERHIIIDINEHLLHLSGLTSGEVIGKTLLELGLADEKIVMEIWQEFENSGFILNKESFFKTKDGAIVDCLFSTERIQLNEKLYWFTTIVDISLRKKSEDKLANIYERVTDAFVAIDSNWYYTYVNKKAGELLGKDPEYLVGKHIWTEFPEDIGQPVYLSYHEAMEEQQMITMEEYYQPYDRWFQNLIYPSPEGLSVFFSDITVRKKAQKKITDSELRFRTLTRNAPVGIFETDELGVTTYVNETWTAFTGLSFEEAMGDGWLQAVHSDDREALMKGWQVKTEKEEESLSEYRVIDKNDKLRWVNGKAVPIISDEGKITGYIGTIADITETKLALQLIKQSEDALNKAQEISKTGSWEFNLLNGELNWSKEQYRIFELEGMPAEKLYEAYRNKYHPDDLPKLDIIIAKAVENAEGFVHEHRIVCNDGSIKYILGKGEVVLSTEGKVVAIKGTGQDITDSKKYELEILQAHQKMDTLVNTVDGIVWEANAKTFQFTYISKKVEDVLGYPAEQWIEDHQFWADHIHPDDKNWAVDYCVTCTREKRQHDFEYRMLAKDGTIVWLRDFVSVIVENDEPVQLRGIMIDITESKKAEQRIKESEESKRLILNSALDAVVIIDVESKVTFWNPQAEKVFGWTESEIIGKKLTDTIIPSKFRDAHSKGMSNYLQNNEGPILNKLIEISAINKNKEHFPIELSILPVVQGNKKSFCAFIRDITDRKRAESDLKENSGKLRKLSTHLQNVREDERKNIAREIHDELGQQLTGLKMDIAWLMKRADLTNEAVQNKFNDALSLVDATVSSIRRISTELRPSIIDDLGLNAALEWQVSEFKNRLALDIEYENNFNDQNINPVISIGLFRILQESLTNVAKHAAAKKVKIKIEQLSNTVHLSVRDDGVGFDTGAKQTALTFGLLGIRERTGMMNGNFVISSAPNKGTEIQVKIPLG